MIQALDAADYMCYFMCYYRWSRRLTPLTDLLTRPLLSVWGWETILITSLSRRLLPDSALFTWQTRREWLQPWTPCSHISVGDHVIWSCDLIMWCDHVTPSHDICIVFIQIIASYTQYLITTHTWYETLHLHLTYIILHLVASELNDPICHSGECQIGSFSSEATICI